MLLENNILVLLFMIYLLLYIHNKCFISNLNKCNSKNVYKKNETDIWKIGNYIDLGSNNGDSILWFYNIDMPNIKSSVPYPKILVNITKNFNTYIFEANPFLCKKIYDVVKHLKLHTTLINFSIYCPVIASTYNGTATLTIDNWDLASSKYYESNANYNKNRRNYTLPVINIVEFIQNNIPSHDFNVMKFDVEGEEHFIIPKLISSTLLSKFDILYSEFHTGNLNNPVKEKGKYIYEYFLNYTTSGGIEIYEERKITNFQKKHHLELYNELINCRKGNYRN